jgi:nitrite reductase/ring-hydroxylating ferredoxin subunit/uncharacterized membrane protein
MAGVTRLRAATHLLDGGVPRVPAAAGASITGALERLSVLDRPAALLQRGVRKLVPHGALKDGLSGTWLGHPLHPALTDVVIGSWTSALLLDLTGGERSRPAAKTLLGAGILASLPTAAAGASDWAELRGGSRRTGLVHALGNSTALLLQISSWRARRRGDHASGVALSTAAMGVASFSAFLGGHLSYVRGVGVNETAFEDFPDAWMHVTDESLLEDGQPIRRLANGSAVMLVRYRGKIHAIADRCSHRGCSLSEGEVANDSVTCPCHGSRFGLDGTLLGGPAIAPQPVLEVRVRDGGVEVRRPPADA